MLFLCLFRAASFEDKSLSLLFLEYAYKHENRVKDKKKSWSEKLTCFNYRVAGQFTMG